MADKILGIEGSETTVLVKRKRGRPRKVLLPEEVLKVVDEVKNKEHEEFVQIVKEEKAKRKGEWDVKLEDQIDFFDTSLSYEITGYKPINKTQGLDFRPEWFTEVRETFLRTGHYSQYSPGSKAYADFWTNEYIKCREGMTVNGYTITGDHYFFLNYYQLLDTTQTAKAAAGRTIGFPKFTVALYEYLHYIEMAKRLRKHAVLMKARGLGFSEMNASIVANIYSTRRRSRALVAAHISSKLGPTLEKIWNELSYLNDNTDGGFFKLRQVLDKADQKRASYFKYVNGQKVEDGWMSLINGVIADTPDKIRGERVDLLIYEEAGSWGGLRKAFIQGEALVNILGERFGVKLAGGTGGDKGPELEGLKELYYSPEAFGVLPFRHSFTPDGSATISGYFLPAFSLVLKPGFIDERGWCDPEKAKEYHMQLRNDLAGNPKALIDHCAEFCFTAEEAFALEGDNKFNKVNLSDLLALIRVLKKTPHIDTGHFNFVFKDKKSHKIDGRNIESVIFMNDGLLGKVKILEHPLWLVQREVDAETGEVIREPIPMSNNLYVAGVDGIDIGLGQTSEDTKDPSSFCMVIKKRVYGLQDPLIVAIYKDRPDNIHEAYHTAIALAMYYNAMINIEATRVSFATWARGNYFLNWFMRRPSATYSDITKRKTNLYGSPATLLVIAHQTDLIADFINAYCHTIWFEEMLLEAISYSDENKRKFDIIAAWAMAELADEELSGVIPRAAKEIDEQMQDIGFYKDEHGHKRWGIIPKNTLTQNTNFNPYINPRYDDYNGVRTSDPRLRV